MKHFYKKKSNSFFLPVKVKIGKIFLLIMSPLFLFNLEVTAQQNVSYNLNSSPVTGTYNSAFGHLALYSNTTGYNNTANGFNALFSNTIGYSNLANGYQTMYYNTTGNNNTSNGFRALFYNTTGYLNTANGYQSLYYNTTGYNNTADGYAALYSNTTGSNNTALGYYADVSAVNLTNATAIGNSAKVTASNAIQLGNANVTKVFAGVGNAATLIAGSCVLGTVNTPAGYKLYVEQGILTEKVKVALKSSANWADYVFEKEYKLNKLEDVEQFINKNKHLPNVPSAAEVLKDGIDLGKMDAKLLEKIEELTLYMIDLNKKSELQDKKIEMLQKENEILKTAMNSIQKQ
ncbi:MAG: hypothetical protein WBP45_03120 [Daejeonella sp.]